ncbi:nuclear transport factor 2 family protein [Shewanella woodyi]|uniref:Nuclear transport factor 2 family protein n=1 Tax=Shewanella woodyi (strain ATCC 51908 / MS32) TaxID=392500 RepID=B1KN16_SHEWM|nr:nuclear transport factor 2 family protein [Shewanella woodyi]ACA88973.1 conserved hypothetical protein [Shewanella woodyi ATCC 51908]
MFKWITLSLSFFFSTLVLANSTEVKLEHFAKNYFDLWVATQAPDASKEDIENYLALLTQDIGHQHLPYDSDDIRQPDGKENMRKGMLYYLGGHTEHSATLISITVGYNVVIIKYDTVSKGIHPQTKTEVRFSYDTTEVLEIENGKVSVIRKYSE